MAVFMARHECRGNLWHVVTYDISDPDNWVQVEDLPTDQPCGQPPAVISIARVADAEVDKIQWLHPVREVPRVLQTQRTRIGDDLFANVRQMRIDEMESKGMEYEAVAVWLSDSNGTKLGKVTCRCKSGNCDISKTCDTGVHISCDCISCNMTCS